MRIHDLTPAVGSNRPAKRLGRGIGSGLGKTSGKGHKGQWARSGGGVRIGFEGGTMPLMRRLPKTGFDNYFKKSYSIINLFDLENFEDGATVTPEILVASGIIRKLEPYGVKVLGGGEIKVKLHVSAQKFSKSAAAAIEAAGGKVVVLPHSTN